MPLTFLDQVNKLLITVGELPVGDFEGFVARKAVVAFEQALTFVSSLYRWPHLRVELPATSWVGESVAVLPAFQSVIAVFLRDASTKYRLHETSYSQLQRYAMDTPGFPRMWAHRDQTSLLFSPVSLEAQPKLSFYLLLMPTIPVDVSDVITLDPVFLQCVMLYAEAILCRTHTADLAAAQAATRQFEVELQTLRTRRESDTPTEWRF